MLYALCFILQVPHGSRPCRGQFGLRQTASGGALGGACDGVDTAGHGDTLSAPKQGGGVAQAPAVRVPPVDEGSGAALTLVIGLVHEARLLEVELAAGMYIL